MPTPVLTAKLQITSSWLSRVAGDFGSQSDQQSIGYKLDQYTASPTAPASKACLVERTVSTGSPVDLYLYSELVDFLGNPLQLATVREIIIWNTSTTPGDKLLIGACDTNPWAAPFNDNVTVPLPLWANGVIVLTAPLDGFAVVQNSSDRLRIAWAAGTASIPFLVELKGL